MKCKLSSIVNGMKRTNADEKYFLDMKNVKVFVFGKMGNYYIEDNQKVDDYVLYMGDIISLPERSEINEYKMINEFIDTIKDKQIQEQLLKVLHGNGAFKNFNDTCDNLGIINDWYRFRDNVYYELAKEWCRDNNIKYV